MARRTESGTALGPGPRRILGVTSKAGLHTRTPSGAVVHAGALWFGGLRGQALYELPLTEGGSEVAGALRVHLFGDLGRVRQVRAGPEGDLWILTGNRDGRGRPRSADDRILRVSPERLRALSPPPG